MLTTKVKIRLAVILSRGVRSARRLCGASNDVVEVKRGGSWWRLDLREGFDFSIYLLGAFERSTVQAYRRLVRPAMVVLDIGANIGAHTLQLAQLVGDSGRVYAFEPTVYAFDKLQKNLVLNPDLASRVTAEQIMLTDRDDGLPEAEIYSSWPLDGGTGLHPKHLGRLESTAGSRAERLDDYVMAAPLKRVDFVKLDVDGFECHVLSGGMATLRNHRPVIIMELSPYTLTERGRSLEELLDILQRAEYRLYYLDGQRALPFDPAQLRTMVPDGASLNVIGRPN